MEWIPNNKTELTTDEHSYTVTLKIIILNERVEGGKVYNARFYVHIFVEYECFKYVWFTMSIIHHYTVSFCLIAKCMKDIE